MMQGGHMGRVKLAWPVEKDFVKEDVMLKDE